MAPDDDPFGDNAGTPVTSAPRPGTMPNRAAASSPRPVSTQQPSVSVQTSPPDRPAVSPQPTPDPAVGKANTEALGGTQPLLVVVKDGKITFSDPAVVLIDLDEVLVGTESDAVLSVLKTVATTRENSGRTALTDTLMAEMRIRLGL